MKSKITRLGINDTKYTDAWVLGQLAAIAGKRRIDEAMIRLVHHHETSPPYEVRVHLATPGPDLTAAGRDHTLQAAFAKVLADLDHTLVQREAKRHHRIKERAGNVR